MAFGEGEEEDTDEDQDSEEEEEADGGEQSPEAGQRQQHQPADDLRGSEEAPIRMRRNPRDPLPEERERHWRTHLPYRAWCTVWVKARGREDQRRAAKVEDEDGVTEVAMDYCKVGDMTLLVGKEKEQDAYSATSRSARAQGMTG